MKTNRIALAAALILGIASQAFAAPPSAGLPAGGHTLSGPGTSSIAGNATETVYADASANSDTCVTVINAGLSAVRLSLVSPGPSTSSIDLAIGASGALCKSATQRVDLICLSGTTCSAQWRVDRD